jgi:uncharacterized protein
MNFPLITDPWFYVCAIPAVVLIGLSKAGFGSGFGGLAVPMMAMTISVPQAAAIMMPLLLVMDILGIAAYRKDVDRRLLTFLLPLGLLGTVLGALLFKLLSPALIAGIVGVITLLFLAQKLLFAPRASSLPPPRWLGAILTVISGFTSFVSHAGGPPYNAYMLTQKLSPVVFTATAAYFFFIINLSKWIPYAWLGLLDARNFATSMALLPFAPLGVLMGVKIARKIQPTLFYRLVYAGMFLTGCKLVWDGFFASAA